MTTTNNICLNKWSPETPQLVLGFTIGVEKGVDVEWLYELAAADFVFQVLLNFYNPIHEGMPEQGFPAVVMLNRPVYVGPEDDLTTRLPCGCHIEYACVPVDIHQPQTSTATATVFAPLAEAPTKTIAVLDWNARYRIEYAWGFPAATTPFSASGMIVEQGGEFFDCRFGKARPPVLSPEEYEAITNSDQVIPVGWDPGTYKKSELWVVREQYLRRAVFAESLTLPSAHYARRGTDLFFLVRSEDATRLRADESARLFVEACDVVRTALLVSPTNRPEELQTFLQNVERARRRLCLADKQSPTRVEKGSAPVTTTESDGIAHDREWFSGLGEGITKKVGRLVPILFEGLSDSSAVTGLLIGEFFIACEDAVQAERDVVKHRATLKSAESTESALTPCGEKVRDTDNGCPRCFPGHQTLPQPQRQDIRGETQAAHDRASAWFHSLSSAKRLAQMVRARVPDACDPSGNDMPGVRFLKEVYKIQNTSKKESKTYHAEVVRQMISQLFSGLTSGRVLDEILRDIEPSLVRREVLLAMVEEVSTVSSSLPHLNAFIYRTTSHLEKTTASACDRHAAEEDVDDAVLRGKHRAGLVAQGRMDLWASRDGEGILRLAPFAMKIIGVTDERVEVELFKGKFLKGLRVVKRTGDGARAGQLFVEPDGLLRLPKVAMERLGQYTGQMVALGILCDTSFELLPHPVFEDYSEVEPSDLSGLLDHEVGKPLNDSPTPPPDETRDR